MIEGQVALVTGGGRGIGKMIALRLAADGAKVAILSRTRKQLYQTATEIREAGGVCVYEACDLADAEETVSVYEKLVSQLGPVQILINNAGAVESAPLEQTSLENWARTLAVNLTAAFLLCKRSVPGMIEKGHGRIVNIASSAGKQGAAYITAYAASKHGLLGLTRSLADELKDRGITVNAVCPGYVETDMTLRNIERIKEKTGRSEEEIRAHFAEQNRSGRIIEPSQVADEVIAMVQPDCTRTGEAVDL